MLSVGAADAFIIYFEDDTGREYLVVVDAGNYTDGQRIIDHIRKYYPKHIKIDLAIVTHPDRDHFGGFIKMLEKISYRASNKVSIEKFWVNDPGNGHVDKNEIKWINKEKTITVKARTVYDLTDNSNSPNLISMIDRLGIKREEKFAGNPLLSPCFAMPCFKILGPTKKYYEQLIPDFRNDELNFKKQEDEDDADYDFIMDNSLSANLDLADDDPSAHNQSSLIFTFMPEENKKFLFMGDAGREAFNNIPKSGLYYATNVDWLKVPHHGSKHNMDSVMINSINPMIAYISTEKVGHYLHQCTVNALKKVGCKVYSTHKEHSDFIHHGIEDREGWTTAIPL